jgi:hypothetical protein
LLASKNSSNFKQLKVLPFGEGLRRVSLTNPYPAAQHELAVFGRWPSNGLEKKE